MTTNPVIPLAATFLVGSFPTGVLAGRLNGIDIRTVGSGNVGATNVFRALGKPWGIATLIVDALKGFLPVLLLLKAFPEPSWVPTAGALAAVLGHTFSPFLRFRGGKGVATSAGVFLALLPLPTTAALAVFLAVFLPTRIVALGSLSASLALPTAAFWRSGLTPASGLAALLALLIFLKHIPNIRRLLSGREHGFRKP